MSSASGGLAPREGLECLLVKMGRTGPLVEPRCGPQAGKSGDPRSQNADSECPRAQGGLELGLAEKQRKGWIAGLRPLFPFIAKGRPTAGLHDLR